MFNTISAFTDNIKRYSWLLVLPLIVGLFLSSCGDSPINAQTDFTDSSATNVNNDITFVPDQFDAVGTIQGTVIDKATGEALSEVAVSLLFKPAEADEPSVLTDTTGSEGTFAFAGVPVNTDGKKTYSGNDNSPYTLKITTEDLENYRDLYRYNAELSFESTGGDGAATNLVSDITIPLSELAVTLNGKAHTMADAILSDVRVELYQSFNPIINGSSVTNTSMLIDSATTGSDGSFSFEGVEEKADVMLRFVDDSDPSEVINYEYTSIDETPAADGTTPVMNLGVINVNSSNESGAFYLTSVTPEPGSDVGTNTVFTYVFNRPVAENGYTRTDLGFENGTIKDDIAFSYNGMKKAPGDVEFSVSFSSNMDTLKVDPDEGALQDASAYDLDIWKVFSNDKFVDEFGNSLSWGASDFNQGEVVMLSFTTNDNNEAPHTPEIAVDSTSLSTDWDSGSHEMLWDVDDTPAEVKEYEIYASKDDGPYEYLYSIDANQAQWGEINTSLFATSDVTTANGFNDILLIVDDSGIMDEAHSYDVKIRAVSANLQEGEFSNTITFEDVIDPVTNDASLGTTNTNEMYVQFTEPMDKNSVENAAHYTFYDAGDQEIDATIESIEYDYRNQDSPDDGVSWDVIITFEDPNDQQNVASVDISEDVTDLSSNGGDFNTWNF